jgi:hypothetical protein
MTYNLPANGWNIVMVENAQHSSSLMEIFTALGSKEALASWTTVTKKSRLF